MIFDMQRLLNVLKSAATKIKATVCGVTVICWRSPSLNPIPMKPSISILSLTPLIKLLYMMSVWGCAGEVIL